MVLGAACAAAVVTGLAMADGAPQTPGSIYYSGELVNVADGTPITGTPTVTVKLFDRETMTGATEYCSVTEIVPVQNGHFRIALDPSGYSNCVDAIHAHSEIWVEISVGAERLPRTRLGAVPYALEADTAQHLGTPDCPRGYSRATAEPQYVVCTRGNDVVVRVGDGPSAFWIDRYEASVWSEPDGTGMRYGESSDNYPAAFPDNGQWTATDPPAYAVSRMGVTPSRELTWFQAAEACEASGKRLPTGREWLRAARATPDGGGCNVMTSGPRATGMGSSCRSAWGADDMIGNLWEWTEEWYAGLGNGTQNAQPWPSSYAQDGTWNIASSGYSQGGIIVGIPAAGIRGGHWYDGPRAGVFALDLNGAVSGTCSCIGFRCVLDR